MGGGAGTETIMGGRQATTLLTKVTWWTAGMFLFFLALVADVHVLRGHTSPPATRGPGAEPHPSGTHAAPNRNSADGSAGATAAASEQSPALVQHPLTSSSRTAPGSPELLLSRLNRPMRKSFSPRI